MQSGFNTNPLGGTYSACRSPLSSPRKLLTEKSGVIYQMRDVDLSLRPGIDVLNNLKLYLDMGINHQFLGSRNQYTESKIGGGTAFIWGRIKK